MGSKKGRRVKANDPSKTGHCRTLWSVDMALTAAQSFYIFVAVFIAAFRPLTVAKEISNIGMGFLHQFLALDVSHSAVKDPVVVPRTDDHWHRDRMSHE